MKCKIKTAWVVNILLFFIPSLLWSQAQYSISGAGGNFDNSNGTSYTIGQIGYYYFYNGNGFIYQGVQQPAELLINTTNAPMPLEAQIAILGAGSAGTDGGVISYSIGQVGYTYFEVANVGHLNEGIQQPCPTDLPPADLRTSTSKVLVSEVQNVLEGVTVYPNPSTGGNFTVSIKTANKKDNAVVDVMNMFGKVVAQYTLGNFNGNMQKFISNGSLATGMYFIRCKVGEKTTTIKLAIGR